VSSENPNHPRFFRAGSHYRGIVVLQQLIYKLHQSKSAEVLHIIIYKPFVSNLTNLKFSYYNHSSIVALVTLLQTTETNFSAQEPYNLLVVAYRENGHAAGSKTDLLLRRTCSMITITANHNQVSTYSSQVTGNHPTSTGLGMAKQFTRS
jgi:predicted XRE-type DNA-binding protein